MIFAVAVQVSRKSRPRTDHTSSSLQNQTPENTHLEQEQTIVANSEIPNELEQLKIPEAAIEHILIEAVNEDFEQKTTIDTEENLVENNKQTSTAEEVDLEYLHKITEGFPISRAAIDNAVAHFHSKQVRRSKTERNKEKIRQRIRERKAELGISSGSLEQVGAEAKLRVIAEQCKVNLNKKISECILKGKLSFDTNIKLNSVKHEFEDSHYTYTSALKAISFPIYAFLCLAEGSPLSLKSPDPMTVKSTSVQELMQAGQELGLEPEFVYHWNYGEYRLQFRLPELE